MHLYYIIFTYYGIIITCISLILYWGGIFVQWLALWPHSKKILDSSLPARSGLCVCNVFICSQHVCLGFVPVLWSPPTFQRQTKFWFPGHYLHTCMYVVPHLLSSAWHRLHSSHTACKQFGIEDGCKSFLLLFLNYIELWLYLTRNKLVT